MDNRPSEMARVYQPRQDEVVKAGGQEHEKLSTKNTPLHGQVETLKEQLADAEKRAAVAEALAEERGKHIEDLRRMLPAPDATPSPKLVAVGAITGLQSLQRLLPRSGGVAGRGQPLDVTKEGLRVQTVDRPARPARSISGCRAGTGRISGKARCPGLGMTVSLADP